MRERPGSVVSLSEELRRKRMGKSALFVSLVALGVAGGPATEAHHAVQAQVDGTKNVILVGVLKKIDWTNPHAWFHFDVKNPDASGTVWSVGTTGPNGLRRLGIRHRRLVRVCPE